MRPVRSRGKAATGEGTGGLFPELRAALRAVFAEGKRLDKTIESTLHARRRLWTPEERSRFVTTMHDIVRNWRLRWNTAGLPDADCTTPAAATDDAIRRILRPPPEAPRGTTPAIAASFPDWLWHRASVEIGREWPRLAGDLATPAPLFLRINTLRTDHPRLVAALAAENIECTPGPAGSLRVSQREDWPDVFATEAFRTGLFEVQDAGSQLIAPLLDVAPGMRVVDACAGAGGKSLHIAALMRNKGRILALDIHEWKLAELRRRAARAGVDNLEARLLDSPRFVKKQAGTADRVLLDVPCSGLGVLRRNPDRKWTLHAAELDRLTGLQAQLLRDFAPLAKPGGILLYATCSILPSENQQQIRAFLAAHPGWKMETERVLWPTQTGGDAYYAAKLIAPAG